MSAHEIDPELPYPALWLGVSHGMLGDTGNAADFARLADRLYPESISTDFLCVLGAAYIMGDLKDEARRILRRVEALEMQDGVYAAQRSFLHGWLGEYDEAVKQARIAFADRSPGVIFWANHPVCDRARNDPRIVELIESLGFPAIRPPIR
jgi:hypothetical protein